MSGPYKDCDDCEQKACMAKDFVRAFDALAERYPNVKRENLAGAIAFFAVLRLHDEFGATVAKLALHQMTADIDFLDGVEGAKHERN